MPEFLEVDPGELFLPPSRSEGADRKKLTRQIDKFGCSLEGMPALQVTRGKDGYFRINDAVTRATRAAMLRPGISVLVEMIAELPKLNVTRMPRVKDQLP